MDLGLTRSATAGFIMLRILLRTTKAAILLLVYKSFYCHYWLLEGADLPH
jgi:predicted secreted protein